MDDDATRRNRLPVARTEINWDKLDITKFYVLGAGMFTGVTVMLYPIAVVKTRLQVASPDAAERSAFSVIKGLLKRDGIPGLYRGFGIVSIGAIPARILFLTALEKTKVAAFKMIEPLKLSQTTQAALANGVAGMIAATCSQAVFVPIDVVSQRLMVQGYSGHATYNGGLDVVRKVIKSDGIRGLYRGFGLSVMTYSPSNAVWWASYGSSQRVIWRILGYGSESDDTALNESKILLVQASGGIFAAATASCVSTPLDTIKTRLQCTLSLLVQGKMKSRVLPASKLIAVLYNPRKSWISPHTCSAIFLIVLCRKRMVIGHEKKPTIKQVVRNLIAADGWTGLYRGLGARFFSMSAWGTSMILSYEYLKRICLVDK